MQFLEGGGGGGGGGGGICPKCPILDPPLYIIRHDMDLCFDDLNKRKNGCGI